jgi:hypothetical protein
MSLAGPRKSDLVLALRRIFVHSSARAQAAVTARAKKLDRAREDLERLERGLGSRHYPTEAKVSARIAVITAGRRVGAYLQTGTGTGTGKPTLTRAFDQEAIDAEAAADGWYALLANLGPGEADAAGALRAGMPSLAGSPLWAGAVSLRRRLCQSRAGRGPGGSRTGRPPAAGRSARWPARMRRPRAGSLAAWPRGTGRRWRCGRSTRIPG